VQCPRCRAENRDEARFCRECGATFSSACPSCGATVEPGSRFCDGCGAPLAAASRPATRPPQLASPESYTPKHLAKRILTSKAALEGERKQVTVLFADLKDSIRAGLSAHCHLGLGGLYRRTDKREQAHEHLTTARTMYREMGMTYWLEQAEAELHNLA